MRGPTPIRYQIEAALFYIKDLSAECWMPLSYAHLYQYVVYNRASFSHYLYPL